MRLIVGKRPRSAVGRTPARKRGAGIVTSDDKEVGMSDI